MKNNKFIYIILSLITALVIFIILSITAVEKPEEVYQNTQSNIIEDVDNDTLDVNDDVSVFVFIKPSNNEAKNASFDDISDAAEEAMADYEYYKSINLEL